MNPLAPLAAMGFLLLAVVPTVAEDAPPADVPLSLAGERAVRTGAE